MTPYGKSPCDTILLCAASLSHMDLIAADNHSLPILPVKREIPKPMYDEFVIQDLAEQSAFIDCALIQTRGPRRNEPFYRQLPKYKKRYK